MMSKELMLAKALFGGGGGVTPTGDITITQNGTYDVTDKAGAIVNVPNSYSQADEGKVVENGALVAQTSQNISANGTYDTTKKNQVVVSVPAAGADSIVDRSIASFSSQTVGTIGASAFTGCSNLVSVDCPNVIVVASSAFHTCTKLETVNIPACLQLQTSAFEACQKLKSPYLPNCSYVGNRAFYNCYELKEIVLPAITGTLYYGTFYACTQMKTADFGPGLTELNGSVFYGSSLMDTLILRRTSGVVTASRNTVLDGTALANGNGYIYVPAALVASYQAATNWTQFSSQFRALESYTVDGTTTGDLDTTKI